MTHLDEIENEAFVANDGGRWFVMRNIDHCDDEGNWGCSTEYLANQWGYDTRQEAESVCATINV